MSVTQEAITKATQKVVRLEQNLALARVKRRKAETRKKIEFGGLVIKSRMNEFPKSIILGALIDALDNIERDEDYKKLYLSKGENAFLGS